MGSLGCHIFKDYHICKIYVYELHILRLHDLFLKLQTLAYILSTYIHTYVRILGTRTAKWHLLTSVGCYVRTCIHNNTNFILSKEIHAVSDMESEKGFKMGTWLPPSAKQIVLLESGCSIKGYQSSLPTLLKNVCQAPPLALYL